MVIPVQNDCINLSSFESNALGKGTFKNQGTGRPSFFLERLQGGVAIVEKVHAVVARSTFGSKMC